MYVQNIHVYDCLCDTWFDIYNYNISSIFSSMSIYGMAQNDWTVAIPTCFCPKSQTGALILNQLGRPAKRIQAKVHRHDPIVLQIKPLDSPV